MTSIGILALILIPVVVVHEILERRRLKKIQQALEDRPRKRWWKRA